MNIKQFIESSKGIKPYRPTPLLEAADILKLNSNENLFLSREFIQGLVAEAVLDTDPRLYPLGEEQELKQLIADLNNVEPEQVLVSAGGDQVIELLFSLLSRGDAVTAVTPTFSMYPRAALQRGIELRQVSLRDDFTLDVQGTIEIAEGSSLLVVCNPNNPTGNQFPKQDILELVEGFKGLVLVDEAYTEFSDYSIAEKTKDYENLLVLRTFSKVYGLAGLRLGYCITNTELALTLRDRYMMPYPVSNLVLKTGCKVLEQNQLIVESVDETKKQRDWLVTELNNLAGVQAYPSDANFVLFNTEKPYNEVYDNLLSRGIILSKQGKVLDKENCLRVTIAPKPMLERLLEALKEATK